VYKVKVERNGAGHVRSLTDRARDITTGLGDACGLDDAPTELFGPHALRCTFATQLI
jgi:hypothetical protein